MTLQKQKLEDRTEVVIGGVNYVAVDTPISDLSVGSVNCCACDIYKARVPVRMIDLPMCYDRGRMWVHIGCCRQLRKGIRRTWVKENEKI